MRAVKITDAKLGSINYGAESLEYWLKKMKPGDSKRASVLQRDHSKLMARFQRIPNATTEQYKYVAQRMERIGMQIKVKAGRNTGSASVAIANAESANTSTPVTSVLRPKQTQASEPVEC